MFDRYRRRDHDSKGYDEELKIDVRNTMKYKDDVATSQHIEVIDQMVL